ncbi:hypothetical protein Q4Q34_08625 [Flavivirga abyssicola]|uniref:hypothetical protein n=1 Tax=Flavivirga abyssicola TaxID=3063533 RepID=UPI0026DF86E8|nr:hypothetical protein [Flavivirga sp. MEBiC07777]WVK15091.1 hypothetical protein Q4Q34_08625 [Flavivirga sp. MEBiC07777]
MSNENLKHITDLAQECNRIGKILTDIMQKLRNIQRIIDMIAIIIGLTSFVLISVSIAKPDVLTMFDMGIVPIISAFLVVSLVLINRYYFRGNNNPELIEAYAKYIFMYSKQLPSVKNDESINKTQKSTKLQILENLCNRNIEDIYVKWPKANKV